MDEEIKLPEGYGLVEGVLCKIISQKRLADSVPKVIYRKKKVMHGMETESESVGIQFIKAGQLMEETCQFELEEIRSGKFMEKLPMDVIIEPRCNKIVSEVFRWCIQTGLPKLPIEVENEYPYGWNGKKFYFEKGKKIALVDGEYQIATDAVLLILKGTAPLIAMFLAGLHGPLEGILHDAGIEHDFTTDIEGETGVGKTDLTRLIVNGVTGRAASLASNRKDAIKVIQDSTDVTWVMDDYNKAESGRTKERIRQTVSEIIQAQCDSAPILIEGRGEKTKHVHIVISREEKFVNPSTINRTYCVKMEEALPPAVHEKMMRFGKESMPSFICYIIKFVESDYDGIKEKIGGDYKLFQNEARKILADNRIANTIAVQKVLKQIYVSYYKHIGMDSKVIEQVSAVMDESISRVGCEMAVEIDSRRKEKDSMLVLPTLANIIMGIDNGYRLASSEKAYKKKNASLHGCKIIGFCANEGYLSFNMKEMIGLLEAEGEKPISSKRFSKELKDYGLAHIDSEKKLCSYWHTQSRMYHVNVRSLLTLCDEGDIFEGLIDAICQRFLQND